MVIGSLKHLVSGRELTAEEETRALILGWCVEWVRTLVLGASSVVHRRAQLLVLMSGGSSIKGKLQ